MDSKDGNLLSCAEAQDEKDAFGNRNGFYNNDVVAKMPVSRKETHYNMNHTRRGLAIVLNHENFHLPNLKARAGTQTDCQTFTERLKLLGFDVDVYNDLNFKDISRVIEKASETDHTNSDCLLVCVMSHGDMGILYAKDSPYKPDNLWLPFTGDKCPSLAGKPKLFFIQACQGDNLDKGVTLSRTETDGQPGHSYRIPAHADFLIAYSTIPGYYILENVIKNEESVHQTDEYNVFSCITFSTKSDLDLEGFYSWRNTTRGSWFIQALCEELKENQYEQDLMTLLTFVNQRVAIDYESNVPDSHVMHRQKQIPCLTSMLTRLVLFKPK